MVKVMITNHLFTHKYYHLHSYMQSNLTELCTTTETNYIVTPRQKLSTEVHNAARGPNLALSHSFTHINIHQHRMCIGIKIRNKHQSQEQPVQLLYYNLDSSFAQSQTSAPAPPYPQATHQGLPRFPKAVQWNTGAVAGATQRVPPARDSNATLPREAEQFSGKCSQKRTKERTKWLPINRSLISYQLQPGGHDFTPH